MPVTVIAVYRPLPMREQALRDLVLRHVPRLRELGLAAPAEPVILRAKDGSLLEIFDWVSPEAVDAAHAHPEVQKLWGEFAEICEWATLGALPEAQQMFAEFERIAPRPAPGGNA